MLTVESIGSVIGPSFDVYCEEAKDFIKVIEDIKTIPTKRRRTLSSLKRRVDRLQWTLEIISRAINNEFVSEEESKKINDTLLGYTARYSRLRNKYTKLKEEY